MGGESTRSTQHFMERRILLNSLQIGIQINSIAAAQLREATWAAPDVLDKWRPAHHLHRASDIALVVGL